HDHEVPGERGRDGCHHGVGTGFDRGPRQFAVAEGPGAAHHLAAEHHRDSVSVERLTRAPDGSAQYRLDVAAAAHLDHRVGEPARGRAHVDRAFWQLHAHPFGSAHTVVREPGSTFPASPCVPGAVTAGATTCGT